MDGARAASATARSTSSTDGCASRVLSVDVMTSPVPARTELLLTLPGGDGDSIVSARNDLGDQSLHLFGPSGYTQGSILTSSEDTNSDHEITGPCHPHQSSHFQGHELIGIVRRLVFRNTIAGPPGIGGIPEEDDGPDCV